MLHLAPSILFAILAFPSLIAMLNTLNISVLERTREIGMIRAVGGTRKQIRNIVPVEAILLAATGTTFGIIGELYLGYALVSGIRVVFPMGYYFPLIGILAAIMIGLLLGVTAAITPPSRQRDWKSFRRCGMNNEFWPARSSGRP